MNSYRFISCFSSFVCFVLFLVANCSHSWRMYEPPAGFYSMGLWTICSDKTGCRKLYGGHVYMELTRAFMMVALVTSFMAFVWAAEWDHLFHCNFTALPKALITSICNFVAGMSLLIGLVMFEIESVQVPDQKNSYKSWAFYLSCCISILCPLIATLDLVAYKCSLWEAGGSCSVVNPEHEDATETPTVAPTLL